MFVKILKQNHKLYLHHNHAFQIGFRRSNLTVERFFDFCPWIRTYAVIKSAQN